MIGGQMVALTSYVGVAGTDYRRRDGVLFADSHIRIADITDGTSSTLLVGEHTSRLGLWLVVRWCRPRRGWLVRHAVGGRTRLTCTMMGYISQTRPL